MAPEQRAVGDCTESGHVLLRSHWSLRHGGIMGTRKKIHNFKEVHKGGGMEGGLACGVAASGYSRGGRVGGGGHQAAAAAEAASTTPALTLRPEEHTENSNIVSQMSHFLL